MPEAAAIDPGEDGRGLDSAAELEHRLAGLMRLLEVTRTLAGLVDLNQLLEAITKAACQALECDRASLFQYDPQTEELFTRVVTELEIAEIRHRIGHGISGDVARSRQLANVSDPAADPRWDSSIDRATGYRTRNLLVAPLLSPHDGKLLGVIELINKLDGPFTEFDEQLLRAFSGHAAVTLDRARLVDFLRQRDEVQASLNVARDVQRSFMPRRLPEVEGYELASWWYPHQAVGGDYCDVLPLADGRLALVMADVSGHGLGPSLLMASVRAALRALVLEHSQPEVLLALLSRSLAADLHEGRFITLILALVDPRRHRLEFANAGHGPALYYRGAEKVFVTLDSTGLPLGVLDEGQYPAGPALDVEPGDLIVLCTDGIVEAMDQHDRPFGQARLEALVRRHADEPIERIVERIASEVSAHYVGESPPDDLTILMARRR